MASGFEELEELPIGTATTPSEEAAVSFDDPMSPKIIITTETSDGSNIQCPYIDFYEISFQQKIGRGSYGVVHKALWGKRYVAVKEFHDNLKNFDIEIKQLSMVKHPNIIALYGITRKDTFTYMIMEYAECGSLHHFLHDSDDTYYLMDHAMSWARQCADAVAYMHAMKPKPLVHRDLKPLNLLLTNQGRYLKICDFGTVAYLKTIMTNSRGSAAWMAPEVFKGSQYTEKCDVFSWGIVLWEMLARERPFKNFDNQYCVLMKIESGERPPPIPNLPEPIKQLMTSCWDKNPELRPSMQCVKEKMDILMQDFPRANEPLSFEVNNQQPYHSAPQSRYSANMVSQYLDIIHEEADYGPSNERNANNENFNFSTTSDAEEDEEELLQILKEKERLLDFYMYMKCEEYVQQNSIDSPDSWVYKRSNSQ